MAAPVAKTFSAGTGVTLIAGRAVSGKFRWMPMRKISFATGVAKSVPIHEYLMDGFAFGNILMSFAGSLPAGVTFNTATQSFVYSGTGSGSAIGRLTANTIPCFVTISFRPTAATFPLMQWGNPMQLLYPFSFAHQFLDGQVLPNTTVYCLSVKNGEFTSAAAFNYEILPEKFRVEPTDYWPSGCLKNATISGQFMAVWESGGADNAIAANVVQLVAIAQAQTYAAAPASPLAGTKTILHESSEASVAVDSDSFVIEVA